MGLLTSFPDKPLTQTCLMPYLDNAVGACTSIFALADAFANHTKEKNWFELGFFSKANGREFQSFGQSFLSISRWILAFFKVLLLNCRKPTAIAKTSVLATAWFDTSSTRSTLANGSE
jgi:hypothetical protein